MLQSTLTAIWSMIDTSLSLTFQFFEYKISFWNLLVFGLVGKIIMQFIYHIALGETAGGGNHDT